MEIGIDYILYYTIVLIGLLLLIITRGKKHIEVLLLLLFFEGLFDAFTEITIGKYVRDLYRIGIFIYPLMLFRKYYSQGFLRTKVDLAFLFVSIVYLLYLNTGENTITFFMTQYYRIMILYLLFRFFYIEIRYLNNGARFQDLFEVIIVAQIIFTFVKLSIFGIQEGIVGSIQSPGDSATFLPVLTLILVWQKYYPHFSLKKLTKRDWFLVIGVLVIAIASNKRAIWGLYPLTILALLYYVPFGLFRFYKVVFIAPFLVGIIYLGLLINPSFNTANGTGVNIKHTYDYVQRYYGVSQLGIISQIGITVPSTGRLDGMFNVFNRVKQNPFDKYVLLGYGVDESLGNTSNDRFNNDKHKVIIWSAGTSRAHRYFIAFGYIGMLTYYIFVLYLLNYVTNKRLRLVLMALFTFDYFLYYSTMTYYYSMGALFIFIINKNRLSNPIVLKE